MTTGRSRAVALSVLLAVTLSAGLAACGSTDGSGGGGQVVVSAASSLKQAFTTYGEQFDGGRMRASFAGSDELAAQIRQGVRPDVFASANTKLPDELYKEGLVEKPQVFAANRLVLAVPADGGVKGKVTQGAVDAGFVYSTDAQAAGDRVRVIELPAQLKPQVAYGVAVVKGAKHPAQAR